MQFSASNMLFDDFSTHVSARFLHIFTVSWAVPHLFGQFFRVKNFHRFSSRKKILTSLARFLQGKKTSAIKSTITAMQKLLSKLLSMRCIDKYLRIFLCMMIIIRIFAFVLY